MEFRKNVLDVPPPGWMVIGANWGKMLKPDTTRFRGFE
jgi:hypothetical protein